VDPKRQALEVVTVGLRGTSAGKAVLLDRRTEELDRRWTALDQSQSADVGRGPVDELEDRQHERDGEGGDLVNR
jgi:hypothetical protein